MTEVKWQDYLLRAQAFHGHLCSGQILGIRMGLAGLRLLNLTPGEKYRDLVLFIETDRCMADAIHIVTGITFGRRQIKWRDFGKAAVTFLDLASDRAFRVASRSEPRPAHDEKDLTAFWSRYTDEEILIIHEVIVELKLEDRPGRPLRRVPCSICGEDVLDGREVEVNGHYLCRACAGEAYYRIK
ncbi:MAG: FmdE family protein [Candidatus Adiutrix intracellularis]|jgi:formylmethanofuran dehydrogenase subunit E|nr:FmdE family protein [Candidatus Adiutrix intracellularis]